MSTEHRIRELHSRGTARTVAAELLGLSRTTFSDIIDNMGLNWPSKNAAKIHEINGISDTIKGHAERLGIAPESLRWRIRNSFDNGAEKNRRRISLEDAQRFVLLRQQGVASWDAANRIGRAYRTAHAAALRLCPGYRELSASAPRVRRTRAQIKGVKN